jgi:hypothetical protein
MHEMQDAMVPLNFPLALGNRINPQVPLPGRPGEFIWKARLVSQLNDNAFLSKDQLQRVKAAGNQYYSEEELKRLRIDPNVKTLVPGHDIAVLFEREDGYGPNSTIATSVQNRRDGNPTNVDRKSKGEAYFELGRVQMIKRKVRGKFQKQNEILDMENPGAGEVWLLALWYTSMIQSRKTSKWKYDGQDKCWVSLSSVIQTVTLDYNMQRKHYVLSPLEHQNLIEYISAQNE